MLSNLGRAVAHGGRRITLRTLASTTAVMLGPITVPRAPLAVQQPRCHRHVHSAATASSTSSASSSSSSGSAGVPSASAAAAASHLHESPDDLALAHSMLAGKRNILVLTGAGISTDSGVPDYRSPNRPPHRPTSHQQFLASHSTRQRYWARSMQGFDTLSLSLPNSGHHALGVAEESGRILGVITQNVDLLHEGGGSRNVLHLHGTVEQVRCMSCHALSSRKAFQDKLRQVNPRYAEAAGKPGSPPPTMPRREAHDHKVTPERASQDGNGANAFATQRSTSAASLRPDGDSAPASSLASSVEPIPASLRPDGDSDIQGVSSYEDFVVPSCSRCTDGLGKALPEDQVPPPKEGSEERSAPVHQPPPHPAGILKPELVFFGANVAPGVHDRADAMLAKADALLIVGTSLTVWSAFRLIRAALARIAPGESSSVVAQAELLAKARQALSSSASATAFAPQLGGTTVIEGGAAVFRTLHANQVSANATSEALSIPRARSALPIVIVNSGPTRADVLLDSCSGGMVKLGVTRASPALHHLLDIDGRVTQKRLSASRERQASHRARGETVSQEDELHEMQRRQRDMSKHANIE